MAKYIQGGLEQVHAFVLETTKETTVKDKNIEGDVKVLISVKEHMEEVFKKNDDMILYLDCLDESLKTF